VVNFAHQTAADRRKFLNRSRSISGISFGHLERLFATEAVEKRGGVIGGTERCI